MVVETTKENHAATFSFSEDNAQLILQGEWTVRGAGELSETLQRGVFPKVSAIQVDGHALSRLDTAGALLLQKIIARLQAQQVDVTLTHFTEEQRTLLTLVVEQFENLRKIPERSSRSPFYLLGRKVVNTLKQGLVFFSFFGELSVFFARAIAKPARVYWRSILAVIETCGYNALPIIGLLCFLIGITLAYQMGLQLRSFGANIFIVDLIGISILREFAPLIAAIILAGRTGSAFTAQLGTMKINEEIDALRTMGVHPMTLLVLPKLGGMIIVVPLLTVWADFFGVLGGMVMAKGMLAIPYTSFIKRFNEVILLRTFLIGLVKAPIFAMIITAIGCYQGFQVSLGADSVGRQTTRSVVQAIFFIIIADAAFSVYFSWIGI